MSNIIVLMITKYGTFFPPAIISIAVGKTATALALRTDVISWNGMIFWNFKSIKRENIKENIKKVQVPSMLSIVTGST